MTVGTGCRHGRLKRKHRTFATLWASESPMALLRALVIISVLLVPAPAALQAPASPAVGLCSSLVTNDGVSLGEPGNYEGFFLVEGSAVPPRRGRGVEELQLVLDGPRTIRRGAPLSLSLSARNRRPTSVTVMRAVDGSFEHWRDPAYDVFVEARDGRVFHLTTAPDAGRCGMVNRLSGNDLVTLPAGSREANIAGPWADHMKRARLTAPGRYKVWVVYRQCGQADRNDPDGLKPEATPLVVASNAINIEVR